MPSPTSRVPGREPEASALPLAVRRLDSGTLLEGAREIIIVHRGQEYRLRVTRAEKLILTK